MQVDIFNGDADGIFALHQFRLKFPQPQDQIVTGVKRDIRLLSRLEELRDSSIAVFDISMHSNLDALQLLLETNNSITYFDHHFAGEMPDSPLLQAHIETSAKTCTSLLVNTYCDNSFPLWAICGAFGDNLHDAANELAASLQLSKPQVDELRELGELFNYNGYGSSLSDLHFDPARLYRSVSAYSNPFDFCANSTELETLRNGHREDLQLALEQEEEDIRGRNRIYIFPDAPWARRVSGVFSNLKAREKPDSAHAIITENSDATLRISVRAPLNDKRDAHTLCNLFPTGGGRAGAAGINSLPADQYDAFVAEFLELYPSR
jgi:hypothetical protein